MGISRVLRLPRFAARRSLGLHPHGPAPIVRRYHFHAPGLIYVLVTLFIAVGAINSQNNLLFAALGLAMGGLLASGVLSGSALLGVRLQREPTAPGSVGQPLAIRYSVRNVNRIMPVFGLHVEEIPERAGGAAGAVLRSAHAFVVHIGPGDAVRTGALVTPRVRGEAFSAGVRVWSTFPFGLVKKSLVFPLERRLEVRPAPLPLRRNLVARLSARAAAGVGAEQTPGAGDEFFGLREYTPGDSPRRIAWRASARTGALVVRQHSMPSPIRMWVVFRFGAPGPDARSTEAQERAIALGAALLGQAEESGIAVGLGIPLVGFSVSPRVERRHLDRLLGVLARLDVPAAWERAGSERFPESAARAGRGAACVVIHAGPVDRSFGPRHARHLDGAQLREWVEDTPVGRAAIRMLAATGGRP